MRFMTAKLFTPQGDRFQLPIRWYYIVRTVQAFTPVFLWLSALETKWLGHLMDGLNVDRPVYICGLARAGTTIILEILSQHPDVATHRYIHGAIPYLPYWWYRCASRFPLPFSDQELEDIVEITRSTAARFVYT